LIPDLKIIFLILLFVTIIFSYIRFTPPGAKFLGETLSGSLFLLSALGTGLVFFIILFNIDPMPIIRRVSYQISRSQLVSFEHAIPPNLQDNLAVSDIIRIDTDGDNFKEWVVFYQFDLRGNSSPVKAMIYDNDRGNPPIIFPYALAPPHRDYLSEGKVSFELENITLKKMGPMETIWTKYW
jgi:hypothetical protein